MKINLKIATLDDANMIGEVFDLYRIFYNQVSDISVAQQYIAERLKNNESTTVSYISQRLIKSLAG